MQEKGHRQVIFYIKKHFCVFYLCVMFLKSIDPISDYTRSHDDPFENGNG